MAQLSIIIPANRDTQALEETLISVLTHRPVDCEVLVPHAGTYDDPYGMADEIALLNCDASATTSELVAHAVEASQGEILHLLSPGCEVTSDWWDAALKEFKRPRVGCVAPILEDDSESRKVLLGVARGFGGSRCEVRCAAQIVLTKKASRNVVGPTGVAAFYRRSALHAIGGWPTGIGFPLADLDVALSLQEAGFERGVAVDSLIASHNKQQTRVGAFRRAVDQERLFWRHHSSPTARAFRPLIAAMQCLNAGMPWAMAMAACGKLFAGGVKKPATEHRECMAAALEVYGEMFGDDAANGRHDSFAYRKAA